MTLALQATAASRARKLRNHVATACIWMAFLAAAVPLAFIVFYVARSGMRLFSYDFLITNIPIISSQSGPLMRSAPARAASTSSNRRTS